MKKLFSLFFLFFLFHFSFSQEIKAGFIFIPHVTSVGPIDFNNMQVSTPLLSNVVLSTDKTYHNLCYVWGANALVLVNGWVYHPEGNQDIYCVFSKNFAQSGGNVMLAWETALFNGETTVWGAVEVGTSWEKWNKLIINLSLTIPFQTLIWKQKYELNVKGEN